MVVFDDQGSVCFSTTLFVLEKHVLCTCLTVFTGRRLLCGWAIHILQGRVAQHNCKQHLPPQL